MKSLFLRGWDSDGKLSRCLPNTSTFVPNDRSQCLFCVLRCAIGAHLSFGLAERRGATNPVQIHWNCTFLSLVPGKMDIFTQTAERTVVLAARCALCFLPGSRVGVRVGRGASPSWNGCRPCNIWHLKKENLQSWKLAFAHQPVVMWNFMNVLNNRREGVVR